MGGLISHGGGGELETRKSSLPFFARKTQFSNATFISISSLIMDESSEDFLDLSALDGEMTVSDYVVFNVLHTRGAALLAIIQA